MRKKSTFLGMVLATVLIIALGTSASGSPGKTYCGKEKLQRFIPFDFVVPAGSCGHLEVYRFEPGNPFFEVKPAWVLQKSGESAKRGFYGFVSNDTGCLNKFTLEGTADQAHSLGSWEMIEIEPEDVGMFTAGAKEAFGLSADDNTASYYLLMPHQGANTSLGNIMEGEFIFTHGHLYGVIVSDSNGTLTQYLKGDQLKLAKDTWIRDDDIIVLEYRGEY